MNRLTNSMKSASISITERTGFFIARHLVIAVFFLLSFSTITFGQETVTINSNTGTITGTSGGSYYNKWTSTDTWNGESLTFSTTANNIAVSNTNLVVYPGNSGCTYTITAPSGYIITGYSFEMYINYNANQAPSLTISGTTYSPEEDQYVSVEINDINSQTTTFSESGKNRGITLTSFQVTIEANAPEQIIAPGVYTIHNQNNTAHHLHPVVKDGSVVEGSYINTQTDEDVFSYWRVGELLENGIYYYTFTNVASGLSIKYTAGNYSNGQNKVQMYNMDATDLFKYKLSKYDGSDTNINITPKGNTNTNSFNPHGGPGNNIGLYNNSDKGSQWEFRQVQLPDPVIVIESANEVTISHPYLNTLNDIEIYYTTDGSEPTTSSNKYNQSFNANPGQVIRAIAVCEGFISSEIVSMAVREQNLEFSFDVDGNAELSYYNQDATIYYTIDGSDPKSSASKQLYNSAITVTDDINTICAYATDASGDSKVIKLSIIRTQDDMSAFYTAVADDNDLYAALYSDIEMSASMNPSSDYAGVFDGRYFKISGVQKPLFTSLNSATIKNVVLDNVAISGTGNVGGIVATASGDTRIYNCGVLSGTVSGTGNVGSIAGQLDGSSRVINCYSFADISGGTWAAGIVGYNSVASASSNLQTLVMNCFFYGDVTAGTNIAPVYGGEKISNAGSSGINNYNYYRYSSPYSMNDDIDEYNCALAAEERYLVRHEFHRGILNSNKALCGWYVTGETNQSGIIGKWVLDTEIAPYPIIKPQARYRTLVNRFITDEDASELSSEDRKGKLLTSEGNGGYLNVTVNRGANGSGNSSVTLRLPITDMNYDTYDYNYAKVVLPFYNQYFGGNYTGNKVVTGWEITSVTGGTAGSLETSGTNAYNYADRNSTAKDTERIFAQGGYYNVPKGVTAITITAKWADAVYLSDAYYDRAGYDLPNLTVAGQRYVNGDSYSINGSNQVVYTTLAGAVGALPNSTGTVYDQAIVLVGNYHSNNEDGAWSLDGKPFTIMSADLDYDNEPDFCVFHYHIDRIDVNPIRFDFLWHPGIGMAHKEDNRINMRNQGIFHANGWFEMTETALARYTEFEYDYTSSKAPLILNNGIFEQFVSRQYGLNSDNLQCIILGGNLYMKQFAPGPHSNNTSATNTRICPVSVMGGEYEQFYLSGVFKPEKEPYGTDPVLCFINGGKYGLVAGSGHDKINSDVYFKVDNAIIDEFYGGGTNAANPVGGNINVQIDNSYVDKYCGGPMFGSMQDDNTVATVADGTTFGTYYGAGNGGSSLYRLETYGNSTLTVYEWDVLAQDYQSKEYDATMGIQVRPEYEFFAWAGGSNEQHVARFYVNYAKFDKAQTNNVSSTLTNCTVLNDYYGGGNLGYVNGNATSVLDGCTVKGSVYGGGFSAAVPTVLVYPNEFKTVPSYNGNAGVYNQGEFYDPVEYTWSNKDGLSSTNTTDNSDYTIWSEVELVNLGEVSGNTNITIRGNSQIDGGVYGGGNASKVEGQTNVTIEADANSRINNVFGGANQADVGGETTVTVTSGNVGNVFGTNNQSGVKESTVSVTVQGAENATTVGNVYGAGNLAPYTGSPSVGITGNAHVTQDVYGGGLGATAVVTGNPAVTVSENAKIDGSVFGGGSQADVSGNTSVTILDGTIEGNVYGGGNAGDVTGATKVQIGPAPAP